MFNSIRANGPRIILGAMKEEKSRAKKLVKIAVNASRKPKRKFK